MVRRMKMGLKAKDWIDIHLHINISIYGYRLCVYVWGNSYWSRWRTAYNAAAAAAHGKNMESNPSEWYKIQMSVHCVILISFQSSIEIEATEKKSQMNSIWAHLHIHTHIHYTHKHFRKINGIKRNQIWFSFTFISFHISYGVFFIIIIINSVVVVEYRECAIVVGGKYSHQFSMLTKKAKNIFSTWNLELNAFKLEFFFKREKAHFYLNCVHS